MRFMLAGAAMAALVPVAANAAGVTIVVSNPLESARPAAVIAVPFAEIAKLAPELRMYHVIVRDPKGKALPSQVTNYQHDHRGASYDDLVFSYDFAAGEKRAVFTVEPVATATPPLPSTRIAPCGVHPGAGAGAMSPSRCMRLRGVQTFITTTIVAMHVNELAMSVSSGPT